MPGERASAASTSSWSSITSLRSPCFVGSRLSAVLAHLVRGLRWLWSNPSVLLPTAAALVYRRRQLRTPVMPSVPARLPPNGNGADQRGHTTRPAADGHRWHAR